MYNADLLPSYGVLGNRHYELSNHLGNVLAVITDVVVPLDEDADDEVDGYQVALAMTADYSPFGVQLDGRTFEGVGYRYGFNGMEKDDEAKGKGNSYTTEFRQYDPRLGRWLSIDPKASNYPYESPYVAFHNNPIFYTDPRGDDPPEELFQAVSSAVNTDIRQSWNASFIEKNGNIKVKEAGGTIIKRETESGVEYKVINNNVSAMGDTYFPNYSNVPDGWEIIGEYHTHPYSQKELSKDWKGYGWDGKGMPPSKDDILSLANDGHVKDGHVSIVESGDKRYGIVVTDKKALKTFTRVLKTIEDDMYDAMYDAYDRGEGQNLDEILYQKLQEGIEGYERETGKSSGIQLFKQDIEEKTTTE